MRSGASFGTGWTLALVAVLLAPSVTSPLASAEAPEVNAAAWEWLAPWVLADVPPAWPEDALELLPATDPLPPLANGDGWASYFEAFGLAPTDAERDALARFGVLHPQVAREMELLAAEIAAAETLRARAFQNLTPAQRDALPSIVTTLLRGGSSALTPAQEAALAAVDLAPMLEGAARLARASADAKGRLQAAAALDETWAAAVPGALRDPAAHAEPTRFLAALGRDAAPVQAEATFQALAAGLALATGTLAPSPTLPPDLDAPLANLLAAVLASRTRPTEETQRAVLATMAAELPRLTRGAYNLTQRPAGEQGALVGQERPLFSLRASGLDQPSAVLADALGPAAAPPSATLPEGIERLHAALGTSWTPAQREEAASLESALDPRIAAAMGSLLAAQAEYETAARALSPVDPEVVALAQGGAPLTQDDLALLQAAARDQMDRRALLGELAGAVYAAARDLAEMSTISAPMRGPVTSPDGILYSDGVVVVTGPLSSTLTTERYPHAPVFLLDLGGNDTYQMALASVNASNITAGVPVDTVTARTSIAIDLGGSDRYLPPTGGGLGAAIGYPGVPALAILLDADGDDEYSSGGPALGWSKDAIAIVVDARGQDRYVVEGMAFGTANTTLPTSVGAAVFVDAGGADSYRARGGFARLAENSSANTTFAVFLDLFGKDTYRADCLPMRSCFGGPLETEPGDEAGVVLFADVGEDDDWPEPEEDNQPPSAYSNVFVGSPRYVFIVDDPVSVSDEDGDLIFDGFDRNPDGNDRPEDLARDTDGDGWSDALEIIARTRADDPHDYPVGLPRPPDAVPDPGTLVPGAGTHFRDNGTILRLNGTLTVGSPYATDYRYNDLLIIDLGLAEGAPDRDRYTAPVAANSYVIDLGGDDLYRPAAERGPPPPALASATSASAALVDLGGNDEYVAGSLSLAAASSTGALAVFLDAAGDDTYEARHGRAMGYSTNGGEAFFLDLAGSDTYVGRTQGFAGDGRSPLDEEGMDSAPGRVAVFLDAQGKDTYHHRPRSLAPGDYDTYQGQASLLYPDATTAAPNTPVAAFLDLDGDDAYTALRPGDLSLVSLSALKNNHFRIRPVHDPNPGAISVFLDTRPVHEAAVADGDGDGSSDVEETVAGTDSTNRNNDSADVSADLRSPTGYVLRLPRLGVVLGSYADTTHEAGYDVALAVDLGGNDHYANRAGGASPIWGTSLALDLAGNDRYAFTGGDNLTAFRPLRMKAAPPSVATSSGRVTTYHDVRVAGAQGAGVFGIGVLRDDQGVDSFFANVTYVGCGGCPHGSDVSTVAQGAGLVGVGLLFAGAKSADFQAEAYAVGPIEGALPKGANATTAAQGAGVEGFGLLAVENGDPLGDTTYRLDAKFSARGGDANTTGQGYGSRGVGILLDLGGKNKLFADRLAQGAAEEGPSPLAPSPLISGLPPVGTMPSLGALLLRGAGQDTLQATSRSQAYASGSSVALLVDVDGDDVRLLTPPPGEFAMGQAAASQNGVALLVDHRGNDETVARGGRAQAFSSGGHAALIDQAGSDRYESGAESQAHVADGALGRPAAALLLDRTGNDMYVIPLGQRGQGSITGGVGTAAFFDLGGWDVVPNEPSGRVYRELPPDGSGNGASWTVTVGTHRALGVDANVVTNALDQLLAVLGPTGTEATLKILDQDGEEASMPLEGLTTLVSSLNVLGSPDGATRDAVDRVEFYVDHRLLREPVTLNSTSNEYSLAWDTAALNTEGRFKHPDGHHRVEVLIHPRVAAPKAAEGAAGPVAADAEPVRKSRNVTIDNLPIERWPVIERDAPTSAPVPMELWVDRDLETGTCVACQLDHLQPGPDTWDLPTTLDPHGDDLDDADCKHHVSCLPANITGVAARGSVYLNWTEPDSRAHEVVGYRIFRKEHLLNNSPLTGLVLVGYVDKRVPLRFVDTPSPEAEKVAYLVVPVRLENGAVTITNVTSVLEKKTLALKPNLTLTDLPGPVTGLRALGAEGGVRLTWNEVEGASKYEIKRAVLDADPMDDDFTHLATCETTTYVHWNATSDVPYRYKVIARAGSEPGDAVRDMNLLIQTNETRGQASPGHNVTVELQPLEGAPIRVLHAHYGGLQRHVIPLDLAAVPDGPYVLAVTATDAAGRSATSEQPILLDGTPPVSAIPLPGWVGTKEAQGGALRIPVRVVDEGTGPETTIVRARVDGREWFTAGTVDWSRVNLTAARGPDGAYHGTVTLGGVRHESVVELFALSRDRAGNVEGIRQFRHWTPSLDPEAIEDTTLAGAWTVHRVDLFPPVAATEPLDVLVRPDHTVTIRVSVLESGSGLARAVAKFGPHEIPLRPGPNQTMEATWKATEPKEYSVLVEVADHAGNVRSVPSGLVVVDGEAPRVLGASVGFPGGRNVGRAGETATLTIAAKDDHSPSARVVVHADVSNVSSRNLIRAAWDGLAGVYRAEFVVDRLTDVAAANVTLRLVDEAGNVGNGTVTLVVNGTRIDASVPQVVERLADAVVINWTTKEPARGRIDYGEGGHIDKRSPIGARATTHSLRLEGLRPDTEYLARVVSISDAGVETVADVITFRTSPALRVLVPDAVGVPYSNGTTVVPFDVVRYDGLGVDAEVDASIAGPRGSPRVVGSATGQRGVIPLDLSTARDGEYTLVLRATRQGETGASAALDLVVDRVAPLLDVSPRQVLVPGAVLNVTVAERGSGVDVMAIEWSIGGRLCAPYLDGDTLACIVPDLGEASDARVSLSVPDRAGNRASIELRLPIDAEAPVVRAATVRGVDGHARVVPGADAILEVVTEDATSTRVFADLTELGGARNQALEPREPGRHALRVKVPDRVAEGRIAVPIRIVDEAGRESSGVAMLLVDATPPTLLRVEATAESAAHVLVLVRTNEPTKVRAWTGGGQTARSDDAHVLHVLRLAGLRPGSTFQVVVAAVDEAGHEVSTAVQGSTIPDKEPPTPVRNLTFEDRGDGELVLKWDHARDDTSIEGYRVVRLDSGEEAAPVTAGTTLRMSIPMGVQHAYAVSALDAGGNEGLPSVVTVASQPRPRLSEGSVDPPLGGPGLYAFTVTVHDATGGTPDVVLRLDGVTHAMRPDKPGCREGCTYRAVVPVQPETLASGPHRYSFHVTSGGFAVAFPVEGELEGPTVLAQAAPDASALPAASRVPAMGVVAVLVLAVALAIVIPFRRRQTK